MFVEHQSDYRDRVHENHVEIIRISTEIGNLHVKAEHLRSEIERIKKWPGSEGGQNLVLGMRSKFLDWKLSGVERKKMLLEEELAYCEKGEEVLEELREMGVWD